MGGQLDPFGFKFLFGIDHTGELAPQLKARFGFANHLMRPVLGHMTIRADRPHTSAIGIVNGLLVLLVDVVAHLMTGNAKLQRIRHLQASVKATPKNDTRHEPHTRDGQDRVLSAGLFKETPKTSKNARFGFAHHFLQSII